MSSVSALCAKKIYLLGTVKTSQLLSFFFFFAEVSQVFAAGKFADGSTALSDPRRVSHIHRVTA